MASDPLLQDINRLLEEAERLLDQGFCWVAEAFEFLLTGDSSAGDSDNRGT